MLGDQLFGNRGDFGIRKIRKIQIRLLIFHEAEIKSFSVAVVTCIGTYDGKSAH